MTDNIRLTIDPDEAQLEFDRPSEFTVTVQNLTDQVDAFDLSVVGLSPQYVRFDPPRLTRFPAPQRSAASKLIVTIPRRAKVPARRHVIGVKAQSSVDSRLARVEELRLDFPAVEDLALEAVPKVITSGGRGKFRVRAVNRGSVPKRIQLVGTDSEEAVAFSFDNGRLLVPPFGAAESNVRVKARRPLTGDSSQRAVMIRSIDSVGQTQEAQATFVQRPLLRKPVVRLGAVLGIVAAAVTAFLLTRPQPLTLKDYSGQPQAEVEVDLDRLGLQSEVQTRANAVVAEGDVFETTPAAGVQVNPGDKIIVVVSSGPSLTALPDLKGLTPQEVDERLNELQAAGLNVQKESEESTTVAIGGVTRTSPPAGDPVQADDTVTVWLSEGVTIPSVKGQSLPAALSALEAKGLTGDKSATETTEDEARHDEVVDQVPEPGESVDPGRKVFLTVLEFAEPPTTTAGG